MVGCVWIVGSGEYYIKLYSGEYSLIVKSLINLNILSVCVWISHLVFFLRGCANDLVYGGYMSGRGKKMVLLVEKNVVCRQILFLYRGKKCGLHMMDQDQD